MLAEKEEIPSSPASESQPPSDEDLARKVQAGDHKAFSLLVERNVNRYYRAAFRVLGDGHEAEEMVQSAFLKFWQQPSRWKADLNLKFSTWFYRVVMNLCLDFKRKQGRMIPTDTLPEPTSGADTDEVFIQNEDQKMLTRLLEKLPERQRTALQLCFYEGLSNQEAADVMEVNLKALQSLLMRAKAHLRDEVLQLQGRPTW